MSVQSWEHFFKPEVRSSGQLLLKKDKVSLSQPSDTEIQSYVRASPSFKVVFKSASVESETLTVNCSCPASTKGQFCKHIWAVLLMIEDKKPDFLESKTEIQMRSQAADEATVLEKPKQTEAQANSQAAYKLKQTDYRKQQYQKQKLRQKEKKNAGKKKTYAPEFPPDVEEALKYFLDNGFPLRDSLTQEAVSLAKKKLARVFHPDIGGSHVEILDLNKFTDILIKYTKS